MLPGRYDCQLGCQVVAPLIFTRPPRLVSGLLNLRCPPAISWLVIAVIVLAVKCQIFRGPRSHISQEILKLSPSLAHLNAPPAVPVIIRGLRVSTPIPHRFPDDMLCGARPPVSPLELPDLFTMEASATGCLACNQQHGFNFALRPTITTAIPNRLIAVNKMGERKYRQAAVAFIFVIPHN